MKCPNCQNTLAMMDRHGIEIDYCLTCRGVWLDRGELDKLLATAALDNALPGRVRESDHDDDAPSAGRSYGRGEPQRRRESWWSEIFDFG